jgi:hypothetical protein
MTRFGFYAGPAKKQVRSQPPNRADRHSMKVWPEGDANGTRIEQQTAQKAFLGNINHEVIDFQPTATTTEKPTSTVS